jgi:hypothetical protein
LNLLDQDATIDYFKRRSCGMKFDNLGDLELHITVEHMQKGDIPSSSR